MSDNESTPVSKTPSVNKNSRSNRGKFQNYNKFHRGRGGGSGFNVNYGNNSRLQYTDCGTSQLSQTENVPHQQRIDSSGYFGWKLYFPDDNFEEASNWSRKLKLLEDFFEKNVSCYNTEDIKRNRSFQVELKELLKDEAVSTSWQGLSDELKSNPAKVINLMAGAFHNVFTVFVREQEGTTDFTIGRMYPRLFGFEEYTPLKDVKAASFFGKLVAVRGTVVKVSTIRPISWRIGFHCLSCKTDFGVTQPQGYYTLPTKCVSRGCRSKTFAPCCISPLTESADWQSIQIQELDECREEGRMPRIIDCELYHDLTSSVVPGDVVTVIGVVQLTRNENDDSSNDKCVSLYIEANNVINNKSSSLDGNCSVAGPDLRMNDLYAVEAIFDQENLFQLLVHSLCPSIFGHELIKAGLLLSLFGGVQKHSSEKDKVAVRGDPHILIVGDPGLGKSQLLQACSRVAPRGVFVCGNTATSAGLTVSLGHEGSDGPTLEAGALILADRGCCCIDELDKMTRAHPALLEAMEQQSVSLAKSKMILSLPARAAILAAANPVGGHYNKAKTVSENLKMSGMLLSRFDLVFIIRDTSNEERDARLANHIMSLHSNILKKTLLLEGSSTAESSSQEKENASLLERLSGKVDDPIPHILLRKYITYARRYVFPKLSDVAAHHLQEFYQELRKSQDGTCIPITTRQLEALIRLTQARARLELRETCSAEDALDIIEIMKHSMVDTLEDEYGQIDFQRSQHGSGMSKATQAKKLVSALTKASERANSALFNVNQIREIAEKIGLDTSSLGNLISSLNIQGLLLKKGPKLYRLLTTDF